MPLLDAEGGYALMPTPRGTRLTTGAELTARDARPTPIQLMKAEHAGRELMNLSDPVEQQPWMGSRPCTIDMKPIMGAASRHRNLWFNFGHAHQGFTLGPVCGRLLAELIRGEATFIDPEPFEPGRFN